MKAKWLIEKTRYDEEYLDIVEALKRNGYEYELIELKNFISHFDEDDCVVPQCTINMANYINKNHSWVPGVWLNGDAYKCSSYYPHVKDYLLNDDHEFMTVREFLENRSEVAENHADDEGYIFIRPDSGLKSFTGTILPVVGQNFHFNWVWIENQVKMDDVVVVSSPKIIETEYRFFVSNGEILTGSMYAPNRITGWNSQAYALAEKVAGLINDPDPIWSIDICMDENENYHLLEIGCFSCAGVYKSDLDILVNHASKLAEEQHGEHEMISETACSCQCHNHDAVVMHAFACCNKCYIRYKKENGTIDVHRFKRGYE